MIPLHPVPYIGAPMLILGLYIATLATCLACPVLAIAAGTVSLMAGSALALGDQ